MSFDGEPNEALLTTILEKIVVKKGSTREEIQLDIFLKLGERFEAVYTPRVDSASITSLKTGGNHTICPRQIGSRVLYRPPNIRNPNFFLIGNGFGFFADTHTLVGVCFHFTGAGRFPGRSCVCTGIQRNPCFDFVEG